MPWEKSTIGILLVTIGTGLVENNSFTWFLVVYSNVYPAFLSPLEKWSLASLVLNFLFSNFVISSI